MSLSSSSDASSGSSPSTPATSQPPSPKLAQLSLQDVSDEARAEAARLKAEANKAFVCASSQLVLRHIRSCNLLTLLLVL